MVHSRLAAAKLDDFVLQLHSHDANRKAVAQELGRALSQRPRAAESFTESSRADLVKRRRALSSYAQALNEVRQPLGRSLHQVIGEIAMLQSVPQAPVPTGFGRSLRAGPARRPPRHRRRARPGLGARCYAATSSSGALWPILTCPLPGERDRGCSGRRRRSARPAAQAGRGHQRRTGDRLGGQPRQRATTTGAAESARRASGDPGRLAEHQRFRPCRKPVRRTFRHGRTSLHRGHRADHSPQCQCHGSRPEPGGACPARLVGAE